MEPKPLIITQKNIRAIFESVSTALRKPVAKPHMAILYCPECDVAYEIHRDRVNPICDHLKKMYG